MIHSPVLGPAVSEELGGVLPAGAAAGGWEIAGPNVWCSHARCSGVNRVGGSLSAAVPEEEDRVGGAPSVALPEEDERVGRSPSEAISEVGGRRRQ